MSMAVENITQFLEEDHHAAFLKLKQFSDSLTKLRYEGNQNFRENLKKIRELLQFFQKEVQGHMRLEEKTLFPFLEQYIPRLGPMIYLLLSEHEDFRNCLEELKKTSLQLKDAKAGKARLVDHLSDRGTYFVCLSRSHLWVESQSLYRVADHELRPDEKKKLLHRMKLKIKKP